MGHNIPPFTAQFQQELAYFREFRRGLRSSRHKYLFDTMWDRIETFITSADFAGHPLPGITILLMMELSHEIVLAELDQRLIDCETRLDSFEVKLSVTEIRTQDLEALIDEKLKSLRKELLEMRFDQVIA